MPTVTDAIILIFVLYSELYHWLFYMTALVRSWHPKSNLYGPHQVMALLNLYFSQQLDYMQCLINGFCELCVPVFEHR